MLTRDDNRTQCDAEREMQAKHFLTNILHI